MLKFISVIAVASLAAAPLAASVREAAFSTSADRPAIQTSVFAGTTYRMGLDRRVSKAPGRLSLKLSGMAWSPATAELRLGQGLEFGAGNSGKPALLVGGKDIGSMHKAAKLNGTTTAVVVVLGAAILVGAIFLATHCDNDCDNARRE